MPDKTDRQTNTKSTWYIITAWNDEIALCSDKTKWPDFIKAIHGGPEKCPKTGQLHFQGAIQCHRQVRFFAIKDFLPTAHIEPARSATAIKKYCLKAETAVGEKVSNFAHVPYVKFHEVCTLLGATYKYNCLITHEESYWISVNKILLDKPYLADVLSRPSLQNFFSKTRKTWEDIAKRAYSITLAPDSAEEPPQNVISESISSNETEEYCLVCNLDYTHCECDEPHFYSQH